MDLLSFVKLINRLKVSNKKIFIFGASKGGETLLNILDNMSLPINGFIDNDEKKWGNNLCKVEIKCPKMILEYKEQIVIFIASSYNQEIIRQLTEMGFTLNTDFYDISNIIGWNLKENRIELIEIIEHIEKDKSFKVSEKQPILIISHNAAHIGGATYTALRICKTLYEEYKRKLYIIVIQGGELINEFSKYGKVININQELFNRLDKKEKIQDILQILHEEGVEYVIGNTVISGMLFPILKDIGYKKIVGLVHELPTLIKTKDIYENAKGIAENSNYIVFASNFVKSKFENMFPTYEFNNFIRPQGISVNLPTLEKSEAKEQLRRRLNLHRNAKIVLGCGWGDLRKGIDIFIDVAKMATLQSNDDIHFIWLGGIESEIKNWMIHDADILSISSKIHFMAHTDEPMNIFMGADVFLMTSREDPFPSVALEAMYIGIPVIAFENAGGIPELLENDCGIIVPYDNRQMMVDQIIKILADKADYNTICTNSIKRIRNDYYTFKAYVGDLLKLMQ